MSSSEDEDYMSENFLKSCVKEDVRPGLVFKQSTKRQYHVEEKQKFSNEKMRKVQLPVRELEVEKRQEGLVKAIDSGNKGFLMLQKMGFKPGTGLGKTSEGIIEPIALEVKADRAGLGREAAVKEILDRKLNMLQKRMTALSDSDSLHAFRNRKKDEAAQRLIQADLMKSRRMCQALDEENNICEPAEKWFWPDEPKETDETEEGETDGKDLHEALEDEVNQLDHSEKLELLTSYLRQVHFYCTWCATKFNDVQDLASDCPGSTRDDH